MSKKPVLVVLAAGMGSRYGGLKQIDPVGSHGEAILDYSLFDAHEAGFETAVIIIKEAIKKDFMDTVGARLKNCPMEIRYAYQEMEKEIPAGYQIPAERVKPWGTSHAVLCAKNEIGDAPFAVINADDYYGKSAYKVIYEFLSQCDAAATDYCMVGYQLGNTVTDNGSVARGVCETNAEGYLTHIVERTKIEKRSDGIFFLDDDGEAWVKVDAMTPVSMNMWGYTHSFIDEVAKRFPEFLNTVVPGNPAKAEFFLPSTVGALLSENKATVKVLRSADRWFGVTYAADKPEVVAALKEKHEQGLYPDGLWK